MTYLSKINTSTYYNCSNIILDSSDTMRPYIKRENGLILIIVMWVLTILMVIIMSFSLMTRTETYATLAYREGMEKKFLAEAGIERAIIEIFYRNMFRGRDMLEGDKQVWKVDNSPYIIPMSNGQIMIKIIDDSGKININNLNDLSGIILKNILINSGVSDEDASIIVDSILDWKDPDDLRRLNGAENDYYMSLPKPYKAKNAQFDTLEELLLVKGMRQDILFGNGEKKGIIEFVTIHSYTNTNTINLLSAPREVLLAVPGLTQEIVEDIISKRETLTASGSLNVPLPQESARFVSQSGGSNVYTIESVGYKDNEKSTFKIRTTVLIEGVNKYRYIYYKSPYLENLISLK